MFAFAAQIENFVISQSCLSYVAPITSERENISIGPIWADCPGRTTIPDYPAMQCAAGGRRRRRHLRMHVSLAQLPRLFEFLAHSSISWACSRVKFHQHWAGETFKAHSTSVLHHMTDFSFGESHTSRPVRPEFSSPLSVGNDIQGMFDPTRRRRRSRDMD